MTSTDPAYYANPQTETLTFELEGYNFDRLNENDVLLLTDDADTPLRYINSDWAGYFLEITVTDENNAIGRNQELHSYSSFPYIAVGAIINKETKEVLWVHE